MRKHLFILFLPLLTTALYGQDKQQRDTVYLDSPYTLYDISVIQTEDWTELYSVPDHPTFDQLLTKEEKKNILDTVNQRRRSLKKDTLFTADIFYAWKPYMDRLRYEDPHYIVYQSVMSKKKTDKAIILPFSHILINDTLIIDKTVDNQFKKGDMVVSINGIPISESLKYMFKERRYRSVILMHNYFFNYPLKFVVELNRNGEQLSIETDGGCIQDVIYELNYKDPDFNIQMFEKVKCGYIQISEFFQNNSRIIKKTHSAIKKFKKNGCTNVILDLRDNPGGSGHKFDLLMSIFINKPTVQYSKGQKLKVTEKTIKDFDFLTNDMLGTVVDIPKDYFVQEFDTHPKMYIEGITYYVLMDEGTGSIAASFVNILQYNDAAILVGEPLLHNALKYGEIIGVKYTNQFVEIDPTLESGQFASIVSTTEIDEYTKAKDGYIMPDIHIPYVAKDYLAGRDGMLDKLIEYIASKSSDGNDK